MAFAFVQGAKAGSAYPTLPIPGYAHNLFMLVAAPIILRSYHLKHTGLK